MSLIWKKIVPKSLSDTSNNVNIETSTSSDSKKPKRGKDLGQSPMKEYVSKFDSLRGEKSWSSRPKNVAFLNLGLQKPPSAFAYDPVQCLLAVGTSAGEIHLLGKPGMETKVTLPSSYKDENVSVAMLEFAQGTPYLAIITRAQVIFVLNINSATLSPLEVAPKDAPATFEYALARNDEFATKKRRIITLHAIPFHPFVVVGCSDGTLSKLMLQTAALSHTSVPLDLPADLVPPQTSIIDFAICPLNFSVALVAFSNLFVALVDLSKTSKAALFYMGAATVLAPAGIDRQSISGVTVAWSPAGNHAVLSYDHYLVFCSVQVSSKSLFSQSAAIKPLVCRTLLAVVHEYQQVQSSLSIAAAGLAMLGIRGTATEAAASQPVSPTKQASGSPAHYPVNTFYWVRTSVRDETALLVVGGRPLGDLQGLTVLELSSYKFGIDEKTRLIATQDPVAHTCFLGPMQARYPVAISSPSFSTGNCILVATAAPSNFKCTLYPLSTNPTPQPLPASLQLYSGTAKLAGTLLVPGWCYPHRAFAGAKTHPHAFSGGISQSVMSGSDVWSGDTLLILDCAGLLQLFTASNGSLPNFFDATSLSADTGCGWVCTGQLQLQSYSAVKDWCASLRNAALAFAQSVSTQYIVVIVPDKGAAVFSQSIETNVEAIQYKTVGRSAPPLVVSGDETPTIDDVDELLDAIGNMVTDPDSRQASGVEIYPDNHDLHDVWGNSSPPKSSTPSSTPPPAEEKPDSAAPERISSKFGVNSLVKITDVAAESGRNSNSSLRSQSSYYMSNSEVTCANPYQLTWLVEPISDSCEFRIVGSSLTVLRSEAGTSTPLLWLAFPQGKITVVNLNNGHTVFTTQVLKAVTQTANDVTAVCSASDSLPPFESDWGTASPYKTAAPLTSTAFVAVSCVDGAVHVFQAFQVRGGGASVSKVATVDTLAKKIQKKTQQQMFLTSVSLIAFDASLPNSDAWSTTALALVCYYPLAVVTYFVTLTGSESGVSVDVAECAVHVLQESSLRSGRLVPVRDPETLKDSFIVLYLQSTDSKTVVLSFPELEPLGAFALDLPASDENMLTYSGCVYSVSKELPVHVTARTIWLRQAPVAADYLHYEQRRQASAKQLLKQLLSNEPLQADAAVASASAKPAVPPRNASVNAVPQVSDAAKTYLSSLDERASAKISAENEAANVVREAKEKLEERGERLEQLGDKMNDLEANSKTFLQNAQKLNKTMENKKWWQI